MLTADQLALMSGPASPLTKEANELLCRTGPGTPMGDVVRRYWIPALLSTELPEPDSAPVETRLLGEDLVAFRDTSGRVGLVQWWCSHRGTPLWMGRNEENGLRCLYHGWKYDVEGRCVDQMNEPVEAQYKNKINLVSYPTVEMGGIVWAYMGPSERRPPEPKFEFTQVPESHRHVSKVIQECNWVQAVEGGIDPAHAYILHSALTNDAPGTAGLKPNNAFMAPDHYRMYVDYTDYGHQFWAMGAAEGKSYVHGHHFVMPWTQLRLHTWIMHIVPGHFYVPIDDENCMVWNWVYSFTDDPLPDSTREFEDWRSGNGPGHVDQKTFRSIPNKANKWGLDREAQRTFSFSGIEGVNVQDRAVQEGVGPIIDRSRENLGQSDLPVIGVRKKLMEAVRVVDDGGDPAGAGVSYYGLRAVGRIYDEAIDWRRASLEEMHPETFAGSGSEAR